MAGGYSQVDLSLLAPPTIVETLDFERIFADQLADLQARLPTFTALVESDTAYKILEVTAARELLMRQRVNDAARAVMPAFAIGADLDHLAALLGVTRFMLAPADLVLGIPAVMESDDDLRRRMVLAPEGYSVAGPEGAYVFHALSADPDVLDASAISPAPGEVLVSVLSRVGSGAASAGLIAAVAGFVSDENRRPLTDLVTVQSAQIVNYAVVAAITTFGGPDSNVVLADARARLDEYVADSHRLGRDIARSGLLAALHAPGVQNVLLSSPAASIVIDRSQAPYCTGITITHAGIGE